MFSPKPKEPQGSFGSSLNNLRFETKVVLGSLSQRSIIRNISWEMDWFILHLGKDHFPRIHSLYTRRNQEESTYHFPTSVL